MACFCGEHAKPWGGKQEEKICVQDIQPFGNIIKFGRIFLFF